ncbi:MAG: NrdR family transcriptional regulator [Planctomycetota bacterium]
MYVKVNEFVHDPVRRWRYRRTISRAWPPAKNICTARSGSRTPEQAGGSSGNNRGLELVRRSLGEGGCRHCGCKHFRVIYTRPTWGGKLILRRECCHCRKRMTTWERASG